MRPNNKAVLLPLLLFLSPLALGEIWPPFGHLTPNNYIPPPICTYEQEKVYEDILEEVCTTEDVKNCSVKTVTEEEFVTETVCEDIVTKSCDDLDCDLDPDNCEKCDDNEPSCQVVYKSETKRECSYETQIDKKCFRMYEVAYVDDCHQVIHTQCKLFQNFLCDKINKTKCTKVPKFPSEKCHSVPRLKENCLDVPVRRPAGKCRSQCHGTENKNCREVVTKSCSDVSKSRPVEKNKEVCETIPNKTCKTEKVKRLKLIPKRICTELKPTEEPKEP